MTNQLRTYAIALIVVAVAVLTGCDDDSSELSNPDVGDNDPSLCAAVGDSITDGLDGIGYPEILAAMIGKTVLNFGVQGQTSDGGIGNARRALDESPGFLLILYGANDLIKGRDIGGIVANLREIIRLAKDNVTIPVIATLTPIFNRGQASRVASLNSEIRALAKAEGARLVDLEQDFGGSSALIADDGLHPNDEGEELMAKAFANKL